MAENLDLMGVIAETLREIVEHADRVRHLDRGSLSGVLRRLEWVQDRMCTATHGRPASTSFNRPLAHQAAEGALIRIHEGGCLTERLELSDLTDEQLATVRFDLDRVCRLLGLQEV